MSNIQSSRLLRNLVFVAVCLLLVLQANAYRLLSVDERKLTNPHLKTVPMQVGKWNAAGEQSLDPGIANYLKPDDYILRDYAGSGETPINLFVAYFKSLEKTYGPHAPRICLPGSGWLESSAKIASVAVPGARSSIPVNQLTYEKDGTRILVLYWYQNDRNIWAEEFKAKLTLLPDLIRYRRSDVSLVRLIAPMRGLTPDAELADCRRFAKLLFPSLVDRLGAAN
jgi:EpsI family protein